MSKVWERLLERALAAQSTPPVRYLAGLDRVGNHDSVGFSCPSPWGGLGNTEKLPDFLVVAGGRRWVMDAKYKLAGAEKLGGDDQYQLFAYSHLARVDGAPMDGAIVARPRRHGAVAKPRTAHVRGSADASPLLLLLVDLPFPRPADLSDDTRWSAAARELKDELGALLFHPS